MSDPAWEDEILERASTPLQPREQCRPGWLQDFELNRSSRLALNDGRAISDGVPAHEIVDMDPPDRCRAITVDGEIEERTISKPALLVEPKPDRPDLLLLERPLSADLSADIHPGLE